MYKNYIFDLYGTLVDIHTNEQKPYLWRKMSLFMSLQGVNYNYLELKKLYLGLIKEQQQYLINKNNLQECEVEVKIEDIFKKFYKSKAISVTDEQILYLASFFRTISIEYVKLFSGAKQVLSQLKSNGKNIYLLSNAQRIFTEKEMKMLDIYDIFDGILYSSDIGVKKPYIGFFDILFQKYNLKKEESVMIGNDSIDDIQGAYNYGIDSIYIHTKQSRKLTGQLPDNCKRINKIIDLLM